MSQFLLPYCSAPIHTRLPSQGLSSQQTLIWKSEHSDMYIHGDYRNWLTWSWPRSSTTWHLQAVRRRRKTDGLVQSKFRIQRAQEANGVSAIMSTKAWARRGGEGCNYASPGTSLKAQEPGTLILEGILAQAERNFTFRPPYCSIQALIG